MTKAKPKVWTGYMDGYMKKNLDLCKEVIKKDWDMVFLVDGFEGSGKSVMAQQCAKYCDPTLDIDRIVFNPKEFVSAINRSEKYQAVVYDEAYGGMSSRAAMSEINRSLMGVLAEIRQKNLFVFIVMPCFFEMDKYAAVWRSRGLIHVYTGKNYQRGLFSFYNQERKKNLYVNGKKFYSYKTPTCNFHGRFTNGYTVDEKEYRQKKLDALKAREENPEKPEGTTIRKHKYIMGKCAARLRDVEGWSSQIIANYFEVDSKTANVYLRDYDSVIKARNESKVALNGGGGGFPAGTPGNNTNNIQVSPISDKS